MSLTHSLAVSCVVRLAVFGEHLAPTEVRVPEIRVDCLSHEYKLDILVHTGANTCKQVMV
jgi:hypothetical protein